MTFTFIVYIPLTSKGKISEYEVQNNDVFVMAIGNISAKKVVVNILEEKGANFISLIHPSAIVFDTSRIGKGVIVCPFAIVSDSVELDDFSMMNIYSSCGHDAKVGKWSILSPYATLNGFATLEEEVFMGTHSTVVSNVKVGKGSKIAANSFVRKTTAENAMIVGVPGTNIKRG